MEGLVALPLLFFLKFDFEPQKEAALSFQLV